MLDHLPETGATRERRWRWMVPSVAAHVAIITAATLAPAHEVVAPMRETPITTVYLPPTDVGKTVGSTTPQHGGPLVPQIPMPSTPNFDGPSIPDTSVPTIWPSTGTVDTHALLSTGPTTTPGTTTGGAIGEATVDEMVRVRTERVPRYPPSLRAMQVTGVVEMEFVVDTTGRADLATARVISSPDERFTDAVREALRDTRFVPGRYAGHAVRTLVRRAFHFAMEGER